MTSGLVWSYQSMLNTAHMEKFSTDRPIKEYADATWGLKPVQIEPF
jgi:glucan phosphorylase